MSPKLDNRSAPATIGAAATIFEKAEATQKSTSRKYQDTPAILRSIPLNVGTNVETPPFCSEQIVESNGRNRAYPQLPACFEHPYVVYFAPCCTVRPPSSPVGNRRYLLGAKSTVPTTENDPRAQDLADVGGPGGRPRAAAMVNYHHEDAIVGVAASPKVERLIDMAMRGALPRNRALKAWEPDKLNSRHIGCVLLRAAGYRQNRIAELMGYTQGSLSIILNHPDARTILAAILAEGAKQSIDISATVQQHAPKMLEIAQDIAEDTNVKPETRLKAAFGWLGMYERDQERQNGSAGDAPMKMASDDASRLADAIRESAGLLAPGAIEVGSGSGVASPEARPALGSLTQNLPSDTTDLLSTEPSAADIRAVLDERAAELEAELEQRLAALGESRTDPSFPRPAGVRHGNEVANSDMEEVA
jgi:hypothetical protein